MFESKKEINWDQINEMWATADKSKPEKKESSFDYKVPDGKYVADVISVQITTGKESGAPYLLWVMDIQEGPQAGKRVFKRSMLMSQKNMEHLAKDLHKCNVNMPDSFDWRNFDTAKLEDLSLAITVKARGEFTDVYINRSVDMEKATTRVTNAYEDDDIPF